MNLLLTYSRTTKRSFLNFFYSKHPSFAIEQFDGSPGYNLLILLVYKYQVQKLVAPLELLQGTLECRGTRLV